MRKFVIGGNWKMQIVKVDEAVSVAKEIATALEEIDMNGVDVFVAPSYHALFAVGQAIKGTKLKLAGQNMYFRDQGAFTGEISADSLLDCGCEYVLLGHSERRRIFGEDNAYINQKVKKALEKGLKPVLCIGETAKEKADGQTEAVNQKQLEESLADVSPEQMKNIVIAYEPVWAINNKFLNPDTEIKTATPNEADSIHKFIRKWLIDTFGNEIGNTIPIQYGGSMKDSNCEGLLSIKDIDGGLIGGASLSAAKFKPIIEAATKLYQ
ncbi:triose-phosphate isomerase [Candidatus Lokiarchaeum ossiferum]|uniref:triose-phosphate isomerase n=1 Tax=Candidatus Lokiarchaeum ossiferum TaxID=2951803 RepID=UPI00352EA007